MVLIIESGEELVVNIGCSGSFKNLPPLLCTSSEASSFNLMFALRRLLCEEHRKLYSLSGLISVGIVKTVQT